MKRKGMKRQGMGRHAGCSVVEGEGFERANNKRSSLLPNTHARTLPAETDSPRLVTPSPPFRRER